MSEDAGVREEDNDPFSPVNCPKLSLVVQMRIYDVLMAILNEQNTEMADTLDRIHAAGKVAGALPYIDLTEVTEE